MIELIYIVRVVIIGKTEWNFDQALRLHPSPDCILLGDSRHKFYSRFLDIDVVNVGSFAREFCWNHCCYYPAKEPGTQVRWNDTFGATQHMNDERPESQSEENIKDEFRRNREEKRKHKQKNEKKAANDDITIKKRSRSPKRKGGGKKNNL